ncbi:hypothetical protein WS71_01895 [Burkholderia mayonis]|uniref:Uncharacterized protein n=1 Tax=Burkholderia mayonis TaxID=1385591 RepID=A0A1B4FRC5_9BURK|nr:hypothetical protein WS71_01895 [Burkholderia mayonis]KVE56719.1 hypothetical protein WS71_01355 [Burkholderia mayonis]
MASAKTLGVCRGGRRYAFFAPHKPHCTNPQTSGARCAAHCAKAHARVDVVFAALQHVLAHPHVRADAHDPRRRTHDALAHSSADAFLPGVRMRRRAN